MESQFIKGKGKTLMKKNEVDRMLIEISTAQLLYKRIWI